MKIKQILYSVLGFIFLVSSDSLKAHNTINGGCGNHCNSDEVFLNEKTPKFINIESNNKLEFNSCLNKSFCRG